MRGYRGRAHFDSLREDHHLSEEDWDKVLSLRFHGKRKDLLEHLKRTNNLPLDWKEAARIAGRPDYFAEGEINNLNERFVTHNIPVRMRLVYYRKGKNPWGPNAVRLYKIQLKAGT